MYYMSTSFIYIFTFLYNIGFLLLLMKYSICWDFKFFLITVDPCVMSLFVPANPRPCMVFWKLQMNFLRGVPGSSWLPISSHIQFPNANEYESNLRRFHTIASQIAAINQLYPPSALGLSPLFAISPL